MWKSVAVVAVICGVAPSPARAFCGFYVNSDGGELFSDATQVVLMRSGTRTVLAMQSSYQGPIRDFALVIPVPVVLRQGDVGTVPREVFAKVEAMGAPRLVEYWEEDPCAENVGSAGGLLGAMFDGDVYGGQLGEAGPVTVEAELEVGEYEIVILSAKDSTALDRWLRARHYQLPAGAASLLRPYVESGSKFFVAKVDPRKVTFEHGRAMLSPLRFHYDSEEFSLPIRLGLVNSRGTQDLIVNILAPEQRYEVANYPNVTIPTNLEVKDEVRTRFGEFYAALFDRTVERNPGAVITEYAWDAMTCDPCPGPELDGADLASLGADAAGISTQSLVLTRLHARYGKGAVPNDLVFRAAPPIAGGREVYEHDGWAGKVEQRSSPSDVDNFQARYAIRHPWTGPIGCVHPVRGVWGEAPADGADGAEGAEGAEGAGAGAAGRSLAEVPSVAMSSATAPRGQVSLAQLVVGDIPGLEVRAEESTGPTAPRHGAVHRCGCSGGGSPSSLLLGGLGLLLARRRRPRSVGRPSNRRSDGARGEVLEDRRARPGVE